MYLFLKSRLIYNTLALAKTQNVTIYAILVDIVENLALSKYTIWENFMKRHGELYDKIIDINNLERASYRAKKNKNYSEVIDIG